MSNEKENKHEDAPGQNKEFKIIVNGREKVWPEKKITFEQVVQLAFGTVPGGDKTVYTVTYRKGDEHKPEGTMVAGDEIRVKSGMIFNVTATDKS